jgi:phage baseplate assembly protein W
MAKYRGFNTIDQHKKFRMTDLDLIKRDLLNHFQIRKGEKLMQPNFGSIIWNTLFEPLSEETKKVILEDVKAVVSYDPRLNVDEVIIQELGNGLQIQIALTYIPSNLPTTMRLTFDRDTSSVTAA